MSSPAALDDDQSLWRAGTIRPLRWLARETARCGRAQVRGCRHATASGAPSTGRPSQGRRSSGYPDHAPTRVRVGACRCIRAASVASATPPPLSPTRLTVLGTTRRCGTAITQSSMRADVTFGPTVMRPCAAVAVSCRTRSISTHPTSAAQTPVRNARLVARTAHLSRICDSHVPGGITRAPPQPRGPNSNPCGPPRCG